MTRYLITSDPQIGAHPDYGREPSDRLRDDEQVWEQTLALAVEHKVDAVLHGGDAFQHRRPTPSHLMAFQRPLLAFLAEHDIPVLAINGNHDVESPILPSSLELFEPVIDVHTAPGIWTPPNGGTAVVTLPWVPMSRLIASRNGGDREETHALAAQLLVETARELRADVDGPAILLAHWHADEASTVGGKGASEIFHEPLLNVAALESLGFDAILLGHNHMPQVLAPNVVHIGSPQPIDFGEAKVEHGVWIYDTETFPRLAFLPIESRPFVTLDYDFTDFGDVPEEAALVAPAEATGAVVRVRYRATEEQARRVDHAVLSRALYDAGAHKVFAIQPTILREDRVRVAGVDEELAPLSALDLWIEAEGLDGWQRDSLRQLTAAYLEAVGA